MQSRRNQQQQQQLTGSFTKRLQRMHYSVRGDVPACLFDIFSMTADGFRVTTAIMLVPYASPRAGIITTVC